MKCPQIVPGEVQAEPLYSLNKVNKVVKHRNNCPGGVITPEVFKKLVDMEDPGTV